LKKAQKTFYIEGFQKPLKKLFLLRVLENWRQKLFIFDHFCKFGARNFLYLTISVILVSETFYI